MGLNVHKGAFRALPHDIKRCLWWTTNRFERGKYRRLRTGTGDEGYGLQGFERTGGLFVHIPKAAGVSICRSLFGNLGGGHTPIHKYMLIYGQRDFDRFFKFTFVRNPWDRVYSAYNFLTKGGFGDEDAAWAAEHLTTYSNFEDFVMRGLGRPEIMSKVHFRPQIDFLVDDNGRMRIDYIGRFERIADDLALISRKLGVDATLVHENKTRGKRTPFRDHYGSHDMVQRVGEVYREDATRLLYQF